MIRSRKIAENRVQPHPAVLNFAWSLITALVLSLIVLLMLLWPMVADIDLIARPTHGAALIICLAAQILIAALGVHLFSAARTVAHRKKPATEVPRIMVILFGVLLALAGWAMGGGLGLLIFGVLSALILSEMTRYLLLIK